MLVADVVTEIRHRAQNLGLVDPATNSADPEELRAYLLQSIRWYSVRHALDHFLLMDPALFSTVATQEAYRIPDKLWGWFSPETEETSGLTIAASTDTTAGVLRYSDPATFQRRRSTQTGRPGTFTLAENLVWLAPIPDAVYTVAGVTKTALEAQDEVPDAYVPAMQARTLYQMAADKGKLNDALVAEERELQISLVNNNARRHQAFRLRSGWRSHTRRRV